MSAIPYYRTGSGKSQADISRQDYPLIPALDTVYQALPTF